jgi:hypothetical protein
MKESLVMMSSVVKVGKKRGITVWVGTALSPLIQYIVVR